MSADARTLLAEALHKIGKHRDLPAYANRPVQCDACWFGADAILATPQGQQLHVHDDCLSCAWEEAEAALPEGCWLAVSGPYSALDPTSYIAEARTVTGLDDPQVVTVAGERGTTPTEALHALAARLREGAG